MKPDCTHCRERFSDYLDGLLAAPARAEMDAHLAACPDCRRELERWRATLDAVGALPRPPAPEGFRARVMAQLDAEPAAPPMPARPARPRLLTLYLRVLPVAAMLLIVVGVVAVVERNGALSPLRGAAPAAPAAQPMYLTRARSAMNEPATEAAPSPSTAPAAARRVASAPAEGVRDGGRAMYYANGVTSAYRPAAPARAEDRKGLSDHLTAQPEAKEQLAQLAARADAAADALKDVSARQEKEALVAEAGRAAGGELVFRQTRALPVAVERPEQVLTMYAADPADLIRRAVQVANRQGLEVTLVFKPGGRADISIQVPAERYDTLVAALSNLTAPESQTLSNSALAQSAFFRKALDNYNASNSLRQKQQQTELQTRMAAMASEFGLRERQAEAAGGASAATGAPAASAAPVAPATVGAPVRSAGNAPAPEKPRQAEEGSNAKPGHVGAEAAPSTVNLQITIQRPPAPEPATP